MQIASRLRGWPAVKSKKTQQGQALIYGLFVLMGGLAALFFLFNTGQLSAEKTKLVNTADAVAYSAGVMHARALNFQAYTNRAMLANTVAIAQLVSLSSWIRYENSLAAFGSSTLNPKFLPFYPSYYAAVTGSRVSFPLVQTGTLEALEVASDDVNKALQSAQSLIYAGLPFARAKVMQQVVDANYQNDGSVTLDLIPLTLVDFLAFSRRYTGDGRTRFKEVALKSANFDSFIPKRSWTLVGFYGDCNFIKRDVLTRRGGTELIRFDEWKAIDSLSEHQWVPSDSLDIFCSANIEIPDGWGGQSGSNGISTLVDADPTHYDYSTVVNVDSTAAAFATSSSWNYSGIPSFYDLSDTEMTDTKEKNDPRLKFAIRLRRPIDQTMTSEGRSAIKQSSSPSHKLGLNDYHAAPAGGSEMVAVGASEVYFQRPPTQDRQNIYGKSIGKPNEIGSLFNPYWQVHLIGSPDSIQKAQLLQGVVSP
ncbi:pilus assembly protein TadG-related protein [Undibacterium sp. Ji67W]|uniref:pilus assembly protein TadG-related protein n=1 Tax=Undibacterium sp. Ji67W TaxID=3413042 RepID=UPI003BF3A0FE